MHSRWVVRVSGGAILALTTALLPGRALDKPTGAPLVLSTIETEQGIPLAVLSPDGKTSSLVTVRLHWNPKQDVGADDEGTSFSLDVPPDSPGASIFTAELWNASLSSALAWQQPWEGARWKVLDTPVTDGTGIGAGLAVGMIATAARRPYPKETLVIGSLKPDGTLGAVSKMTERLDAAAAAGITRVIIPSDQRFDTDGSGQVVNLVRHAADLHLDCVPVDNLVEATEAVMNDPLPDIALSSTSPKYSNDVATYIDDFAHREQTEMESDLSYAPKEDQLGKYTPRLAAIWKSVYADDDTAQQAYRAGLVYVAYRLFARANGRMHGVNALVGQSPESFDVKSALDESDGLRARIHELMAPPSIDKDDLESALLVSEMGDWAYSISAELEGAQVVTKQTFSQRSDATGAEKDRAREAILFANAEARYLLDEADFYTGLLDHVSPNPVPVDANAAHLLPQLIPAQLATAEVFSEGIRSRANDMRDGLLFDPRLVAYVNVLRETKAAWDARQRKKEMDATAPVAAPADASIKLDASSTTNVGFDPGTTYAPPHSVLIPSSPDKKMSDVAACLIWVNNDCEIAALDEKYLRLSGTVDPATHEWHVKDRAKLDALLQLAETGAREGISFAEKADVDTSVLDLIYEKASQLRIQSDDTAALDALRNYWRCALLGNMCWQLAHTHKAEAVDLATLDKDTAKSGKKGSKKDQNKTADEQQAKDKTAKNEAKGASTDEVNGSDQVKASDTKKGSTEVHGETADVPVPSPAPPPEPPAPAPSTTAPDITNAPRALPVTDDATGTSPVALPVDSPPPTAPAPAPAVVSIPVPSPTPAPPPTSSAADGGDANIPVAPVARTEDYSGGDSTPATSTNNAPLIGPTAPTTNSP
jgi:hypothetical protein